jgi:hypothetical protein
VVSGAAHTAASIPPEGLSGLDPRWSRLVTATDTDGVNRTWHVLDNGVGGSTQAAHHVDEEAVVF